jgi:hypothetical protein
VPEGLTPAEVGKEIGEHEKHTTDAHTEQDRHDRWLSILEAVQLSLVAVLAAYSGDAAAKWGTQSSVTLASASAARTKANRADTEAIVTRTLDSASFNAWFTAFTAETPTPSDWRRSECVPDTVRHSTLGRQRIRHTTPTLLPGRRTCRNTSSPRTPPPSL